MKEEIRALFKKHSEKSTYSPTMFFKTGKGDYAAHDKFIGLKIPLIRKISKDYLDISYKDLESFITSTINEERQFALFILTARYKTDPQNVFDFYIKHMEHVNNWNLVDASAHLIIGPYVKDDRALLYKLAKSEIMWERRIAIVATWHFIKNNDFQTTIEISEILLNDKHDLIHKAVGWMLREVGKKDTTHLKNFLNKHHKIMPRTMLRYSIERLSSTERLHYMKK